MKKWTTLCWMIAIQAFVMGQEKYQSLFWKIEGHGTKKASYLYGTMHVSDRIAFHLSDEFYKGLMEVDKVALESNPQTWMDVYNKEEKTQENYLGGSIYNAFVIEPLKKSEMQSALMMDNRMVNGLLYRNQKSEEDYEEDTYLDMFIYRSGQKYGREVLSLEDAEEADRLTSKAVEKRSRQEVIPQWLEEKLEEYGEYELLQNYYRDQNLDGIDSLNRFRYTEHYNKYMLYERNRIMANSMDSIIQSGTTLFTGIGAAHLPGKDGVIDMLRQKGYKVTPIKGKLTETGKKIRKEIDEKFIATPLKNQSTADGFITLDLPDRLYESCYGDKYFAFSPDFANGGFITLVRLSRYDYLVKKEDRFSISDLDKVLFENIAGDILERKDILINGYKALDIKNKTKTGELQRYIIIETPIEIIILKLAGDNQYATHVQDAIVKSLKLRETTADWTTFQPFYGRYQLSIPNPYVVPNNNWLLLKSGAPIVQGIDANKNYYFAMENVLNDTERFEEDNFETTYIIDNFLDELKVKDVQAKVDSTQKTPTAFAKAKLPNQNTLFLQSVVSGARYYLLGFVGEDENSAKKYFNSLQFNDFKYQEEFKEQKDTTLLYTVKSPVETQKGSKYDYYDRYNEVDDTDTLIDEAQKKVSKLLKQYKSWDKTSFYYTTTGEMIEVNAHKFNYYKSYKDVNEFWEEVDSSMRKSYKRKDVNKYTKNGLNYYDVNLHDTVKNSRYIKARFVQRDGIYYCLSTELDTINKSSKFVETFFETFQPKDTLLTKSLFIPKGKMLLEDLQSSDSIKSKMVIELLKDDYHEIGSEINFFTKKKKLFFAENDIPALTHVIQNFKFKKDDLEIRDMLIDELIKMESPTGNAFLENLYKKSGSDNNLQYSVIEGFTDLETENSLQTFLKLMKEDIPLPTKNSYGSIFGGLYNKKSIDKAVKLFPELMEYASIPEYKEDIIQLLAHLKLKQKVTDKLYVKDKKELLNEAKIELKRMQANESKSKNRYRSKYDYDDDSPYADYVNSYSTSFVNDNLLIQSYLYLLAPYYNEPDFKNFYNQITTMEDEDLIAFSYFALKHNNVTFDEKPYLEKAKSDKVFKYKLYEFFNTNDGEKLLSKDYITQQEFIEGYLLADIKEDYDKPTLSLMQTEKIPVKNKNYNLYIYKFEGIKKFNQKKESEIQYIAIQDKKMSTGSILAENSEEVNFNEDEAVKKRIEEIIKDVKYKKRIRVRGYYGRNHYGGYEDYDY